MKAPDLTLTEYHPPTSKSVPHPLIRQAVTAWLKKELTKDACAGLPRRGHFK